MYERKKPLVKVSQCERWFNGIPTSKQSKKTLNGYIPASPSLPTLTMACPALHEKVPLQRLSRLNRKQCFVCVSMTPALLDSTFWAGHTGGYAALSDSNGIHRSCLSPTHPIGCAARASKCVHCPRMPVRLAVCVCLCGCVCKANSQYQK